MRKIFLVLVLISFLTVLVLPAQSLAAGPVSCCKLGSDVQWTSNIDSQVCTVAKPCIFKAGKVVAESTGQQCGVSVVINCQAAFTDRTDYWEQNAHCITSKQWGMVCLMNTLYNVTDWIFFALIAVSGILVVLGAMNMVMSQGDPEKVNTGRNYVVYAAIGLAIGFLARAIPNIARMIVGG